jgi:uncharacterized protein (TIGR02588 family)
MSEPLEHAATAVSGLLVAGLLGVLVWDAVHPNTKPSFATMPSSMVMAGGSYRVPIAVKNNGDEAAKAVAVHLSLVASDSVLAESDITIDWLPGRSSRQIVGLFAPPPSGPQPTGVRAEVRGYAVP